MVELLIVVAIIGIIVAVSMANVMYALQRARQKRTMADMHAIGTSLDAYGIDHNTYPPSAAPALPPDLSLPTDTFGVAASYISPTYIRTLPLADGWNSWFQYGTSPDLSDYIIRSNGRDGVAQSSPPFGGTTDFNADVIFVNGAFAQYPIPQ